MVITCVESLVASIVFGTFMIVLFTYFSIWGMDRTEDQGKIRRLVRATTVLNGIVLAVFIMLPIAIVIIGRPSPEVYSEKYLVAWFYTTFWLFVTFSACSLIMLYLGYWMTEIADEESDKALMDRGCTLCGAAAFIAVLLLAGLVGITL